MRLHLGGGLANTWPFPQHLGDVGSRHHMLFPNGKFILILSILGVEGKNSRLREKPLVLQSFLLITDT